VADDFQRHGVRAGNTCHLARGQLGKLLVVSGRQVVADAADLGLDQMEVVEQPFRGWRDERTAVHVVREDAIGIAQHTGVVCQTAEELPVGVFRATRQRETGRQHARPSRLSSSARRGACTLRLLRLLATLKQAEHFIASILHRRPLGPIFMIAGT
jgi:hypothetical protein